MSSRCSQEGRQDLLGPVVHLNLFLSESVATTKGYCRPQPTKGYQVKTMGLIQSEA